jgi:hypothetical protein
MKSLFLISLFLLATSAYAASDLVGNYKGLDSTGTPCELNVWVTRTNDELIPFEASISFSTTIFDLRSPAYRQDVTPGTYEGETNGPGGAQDLTVTTNSDGKPVQAVLLGHGIAQVCGF